jgi:molybdenum cofactor cytidylyltransferase
MIGSRRKTALMRNKFLEEGWATHAQWDRVHSPVGLDIGSTTVQEIALSIAAELVRERNLRQNLLKEDHIRGLVLAAGESKRMGTPKMLLAYGESTIIETVVRRISESDISDLTVVIGADKEPVMKRLKGYNVRFVVNDSFREGMYSSVKCGFNALPADTDAVIVFLGDQPMIKAEVINELIRAWKKSGRGIVIPIFHNKRGHPMLIDKKYMEEVLRLNPEKGLRSILALHEDDIFEMETETASVIRDIDTASDYQREISMDQ